MKCSLVYSLSLAALILGPVGSGQEVPASTPQSGEPEQKETASGAERVREHVDALIEGGAAQALLPKDVDPLFSYGMLEFGRLAELDEALKALQKAADGAQQTDRLRGLTRIRAQVLWRYGMLKDARKLYQDLAQQNDDLDARLNLGRLYDALGETDKALGEYRALLPEVSGETRERLHLRIALMDLENPPEVEGVSEEEGPAPQDPLSKFIQSQETSEGLRNRAAVVLALLGKPKEAVDLYKAEGEAKEKLRGELRIAEWGMAGDLPQVAQEAAWRAVQVAKVGRERRYALTLLAEAHRKDGSLDSLLNKLAESRAELAPETRALWIELLREAEKYDEAIELVQGERAEGGFSDQEQLEVFEMYREADRDDDLIAAYGQRIASEPGNVVWREGLSRYYLESGQREKALAVWRDWIDEFSTGQHLVGGDALMALGLDELAIEAAELSIEAAAGGAEASNKSNSDSAHLFLYELFRDRGRLTEARETLGRLRELSEASSPVRISLADAYERLGDKREAVEVLSELVASRPEGEAGEDVEMRLAWLHSEVGQEEVALEQWRALWERVQSVPRRRYVEDRMMTVASRLGKLADLAVELEVKLFDGQANKRESGLLVRLYTKVGDAVSAAEVIEEFMRNSGGSEVQTLTEKARVYLACTDYYHYEKTVKRLIELDPEGEPDYLRQLAMSQLERGKPQEARDVLMRLQGLESDDSASAEFEAGVLSLSGMRDEAVMAYRRGLARHSDRIDAYILMANLLKELGQVDEAVGMFQFLAETADKDDLFTIAIDGILNMLVDAPPRPKTVQWARRITLERLAGRHDKPYLYQLLGDLASEAEDHNGHVLALENALPSAGPRRGSLLRELMDLNLERRRSFNSPGWPGNKAKHLAMGRRLVGLAEAVPPQVYLDLGEAFLKAKDARAAERTFALTRSLPDGAMYQRQAAASFEKQGFVPRALDMYESVLATQPSDVPLLTKVGELHENLGDDRRAGELYGRAMDLLMRRRPLSMDVKKKDGGVRSWWTRNRNVDDYTENYDRVLGGVLATLAGEPAVLERLAEQRERLDGELPEALEKGAEMEAAYLEGQASGEIDSDEPWVPRIAQHPRIDKRVKLYRRLALAFGQAELADGLDREMIQVFAKDDDLLEEVVRGRLAWGLVGSAKELIKGSGRDAEATRALMVKVGEVVESSGSTPIPLTEAARQILPLVAAGRLEELTAVVRRADLGKVEEEQLGHLTELFAAARFLGNEDLILKVGRDWLRLQMESPNSYMLEDLLGRVGGALSKENELALGRYLVSRVFEDPEKNASLVTLLPAINSRSEEPLVSSEQILELLDGYGEKYAWGLAPVIALLPDEDRGGAVRGVWGRLEKTQRASLLLSFVTEIEGEFDPEFQGFIRDSFEESLEDAESYLEYTISNLLDVEGKDQLVLDLSEILLENGWERVQALPAIRAMRMKKLGLDGATEVATEAWLSLGQMDDYRARQALGGLAKEFLPDDLDAFVAAHDASAQEDGDSEELRISRLELLSRAGDEFRARYGAALKEAAGEYPKSEKLLQKLAGYYRTEGRLADAAWTTESWIGVMTDDKKKIRQWKQVERLWKRLRNPVKQLACKESLKELEGDGGGGDAMGGMMLVQGGMVIMGGPAEESSEEGLPKTIKDVKEAVEEERLPDAAQILRRIWRRFPVGEPKANRFFFGGFAFSSFARLKWPEDKEEDEAEPSKGGLVGYVASLDKAAEEEAAKDAAEENVEGDGEQAEEEPSAFERMAAYDPLVEEMERFLRTRQPRELDNLQEVLKGMLQARQRTMGKEASLADLVDRVREGRAGKADKILLLASLDGLEEGLPAGVEPVLEDLPRTVGPKDLAQIRRLAKVYASADRLDPAMRLYRWCATQAGNDFGFFFPGSSGSFVSVQTLVGEAKELFEGQDRVRMIEEVLSFSDPGDRPWQRENFETMVLRTWSEVLPPAEALEKSRQVCEDSIDLSKGLRRRVAMRAAGVFAQAGEIENAGRALEVALAKLDPKDVAQPEENWYRVDPETPGYLNSSDYQVLFPRPEGEEPGASAEWLEAAGDLLVRWRSEDRVRADQVVGALCWISYLLAEQEATEPAQRFLQEAQSAESMRGSNRLWLVDGLRAAGKEDEALKMEEGMLEEGTLHPERVPLVVKSIAERSGAQAALDAAAGVGEYLQHPDLLVLMEELADEVGDGDLKAIWVERREAAEAAQTTLLHSK